PMSPIDPLNFFNKPTSIGSIGHWANPDLISPKLSLSDTQVVDFLKCYYKSNIKNHGKF
ncbi:5110_t:CDS:1, partial [Funneliformis geosporum]